MLEHVRYEWRDVGTDAVFIKITSTGEILKLGSIARWDTTLATCNKYQYYGEPWGKQFISQEDAINYVEGTCGKLEGKNVWVSNAPSFVFEQIVAEPSLPRPPKPVIEPWYLHTGSLYIIGILLLCIKYILFPAIVIKSLLWFIGASGKAWRQGEI